MRLLDIILSQTELISTIFLANSLFASPTTADFTFPSAPPSNLDISQLGRVAVVGDFAAASLFQYSQQAQGGISTNGSLSLLARFPSGSFANLQSSDAYIQSMCALQQGGKLVGVLVGGNFTSLGGVNSPGIALFKPDTQKIEAIRGLNGRVNSIYCDSSSGTAYVGGQFSAMNNSNAVTWTQNGFQGLPFTGFNGAVTSVAKESNGNIVFGGAFDGLGNSTTPTERNGQLIPLASATFQAGPGTTQGGLSDAANVICKDPATDGPGNAYLLADKSPGAITATFQFGFNPTMLRIGNTAFQGRGTKTWRYTAIPINGIMNFSYVDEAGMTKYCDAQCPLPQGEGASRDYHFVNSIGMTGFRIDISDWYGDGGGLRNLQLFQDDIYTFAVSSFNEPKCPGATNPAVSSTTGSWTKQTSTNGTDYLTTQVAGGNNDTKIVFSPDIRQSGNYSVTIFTPGCLQDNTCNTRGRVSITGNVGSATSDAPPAFQTDIFQTNNFDKYDQIFLGRVDASSGSFKPTVTLAASPGQGPLTVVAQRIRFELVTSSGGLNGLFEYNPSQRPVDMNFRKSTIDSAATSLDTGALINSVINHNGLVWVGGSFRSADYSNFFSIGRNASTPASRGLNGAVQTLYANGNTVYAGGSFTGTRESNGPGGLSGVAAYDTASNSWSALGGGVRGSVTYIVPFQIKLSADKNTDLALAISGKFTQVQGFNGAEPINVRNFAVWIPSKNNWLQNLNIPTISLNGLLTAQADIPNNSPLYAGSVSSFDIGSAGAVQVTGGDQLSLQSFGLNLQLTQPNSSNNQKRALAVNNSSGVLTGLYYNQNNKNLTVLAGRFSATSSSGTALNNLIIIDGKDSDKVSGFSSGVSSSSTITSIAISGNSLFAGGAISGTVNGVQVQGLVVYDLSTSDFARTQPAALQGSSVTVNAIAAQPSSQSVFVGGSFATAGSLPCAALCIYDTERNQWTSPAGGFTGSVASMTFVDDTRLMIAGNLTVNGTATTISIYDSKNRFFTAATSDGAPTGSITALTAGSSNGQQAWVAGTSQDGAAFLSKFDGSTWTPGPALATGSVIRGIQIFTLRNGHGQTPLLDQNTALLLFGNLVLPSYGNASAALYNGTDITPFLYTNTAEGTSGSVSGVFVSNPLNFFKAGRRNLHIGLIVLIGLALSLVVIFILIGLGMLAAVIRRRRQGYVAAPSPVIPENMDRVPPAELLGTLTQGRQGGRGWTTQPTT